MYRFARMGVALLRAKFQSPMGFSETHESHHVVMPWDMDLFGELNNGITLTLLDLNRLPFGARCGWNQCLIKNKWMMTMAGVSVRYRKRIHMFERIRITCRAAGRDE